MRAAGWMQGLRPRARILAVSHDAYLYGAQRSLLDAAAGLAGAGHQVDVCTPDMGPLVDLLRAQAVQVHLLRFHRWILAASSGGIRHWLRFFLCFPLGVIRACRLIRKGRYDVVYTNTVTVLDFAVAARILSVPHVWHLREAADNPQLRSLLPNRKVIALVRALSAQVIYNSHALLARYGGSESEKDVVVHNGLQVGPGDLRAWDAINNSHVNVVVAGVVDQRKGLDVLLDAIALLPEAKRTRVVLHVAGHVDAGYWAREIEPRMSHLGVDVRILGWVERMDDVYASADLLVSSARDEPFGRTLVEAMMRGIAVLATRSGGPQEIVVDGVTGLLVPPDDPQALCRGLERLLEAPQLLASYGHAGRRRALDHFSLQAYVQGVETCLLQAIASAGTRP